MKTIKQKRTASHIKMALSELFYRELSDPRLQMLTVTDVRIDRELLFADVYVHAFGEDERQEEVMAALEKAAGFLRHHLGQQMRLRQIPNLHFHWDPTLTQAAHIHELLDNLDIPPANKGEEE
ncbi:MAG TPA: 30S ribosome-binding factor RbfA [Anaerolineae bacterium]|nr:30S ribosome-binding factor RbfA [Anaerolineae bacterium]